MIGQVQADLRVPTSAQPQHRLAHGHHQEAVFQHGQHANQAIRNRDSAVAGSTAI